MEKRGKKKFLAPLWSSLIEYCSGGGGGGGGGGTFSECCLCPCECQCVGAYRMCACLGMYVCVCAFVRVVKAPLSTAQMSAYISSMNCP